MDTAQERKYHMVQFLDSRDKLLSPAYTVPASWIRYEIKSSETVLLAYPKESWEITRERVKNYEDPDKDWESNLAQIKYSADCYDQVIRCVNERDRSFLEETTTQSADRRSVTSCSVELNRENFGLEFAKWVRRQPSSLDESMLVIKSIDEFFKLRRLVSMTIKRLKEKNGADNKAALSFAPKFGLNQRWTLKHRKLSPELIELVPNSGILIRRSALNSCISSTTKCTHLARLLTTHIFSELALKKCVYICRRKSKPNLCLDQNATLAIVNFVEEHGRSNNWLRSNKTSIKNAIRYQLKLSKENNK